MALAIVILAVRDPHASARFYESFLGWKRAVDVPVYVELSSGEGAALGLYQAEGFARNTGVPIAPRGGPGTSPAECYFRVADLDEAERAIRAAGGVCLSPRAARSWGETVAYYLDPDGHVVALAQR